MMAIKCQVHDCIYNEEGGKCFAKNVMIGNHNARSSAETRCNSYASETQIKNYEFSNEFLNSDVVPADANKIKCSAMNCRYNSNQDCTATTVVINHKNANCETFVP